MASLVVFVLVVAALLILLGRMAGASEVPVGGGVEARLWGDLLAGVAWLRGIGVAHAQMVERYLREMRGDPPGPG